MKDNVVLTKDPTLVFHEKLPLESSPGVTDLNGKIKHEPSQEPPARERSEYRAQYASYDDDAQGGRRGRPC